MVPYLLIFTEPVHHRSLGGAEFDPFRAIQLYLFVVLLGKFERLLADVVNPIELALKRKFSRQRFLQRAAPPYRDGGLTLEVMPEVNHAHGVLNFLDRNIVDQHHFVSGLYVDVLESRKGAGDILDAAVELNLGRGKHASMRIDTAHPAETVALEQQFFFELYRVVSTQLRTDVNRRGVLEFRCAVFEGQLMVGPRPSLVV